MVPLILFFIVSSLVINVPIGTAFLWKKGIRLTAHKAQLISSRFIGGQHRGHVLNAGYSTHISEIADFFEKQNPDKFKKQRDNKISRVSADPETEDECQFMSDYMEQLFYAPDPPKIGDMITGEITAMDERGVFVDSEELGMKALLPWHEISLFPMEDSSLEQFVKIGRQITAKLVGYYSSYPVISLRILEFRDAWKLVLDSAKKDETLTAVITAVNKGGAMCVCYGLKSFIPASHLTLPLEQASVGKSVKVIFLFTHMLYNFNVATFLKSNKLVCCNYPVKVKILSANETTQQIQLSARRAKLSQSTSTNGTLIKSIYSVGSIITGKISGFANYGAFVVFDDGITGLLHAKEISRSPLDRNITQLFRTGERIKVVVSSVDPVAGRCGLSTKEFEESAGDILVNATKVFENAEAVFERFEALMTVPINIVCSLFHANFVC